MPVTLLSKCPQPTEATRSHPEMVGDMSRVTAATSSSRPVYNYTGLEADVAVTASLFTFESFIKIFFPTKTSIKNSFCAFLARVKTYTHTKN